MLYCPLLYTYLTPLGFQNNFKVISV